MRPFIIIREFEKSDEVACQEVVKTYVMSFVYDSFLSYLFREITLQLVVLVWAILFIFFGIPLLYCALCIPFVFLFLFICVYVSYLNKSLELSRDKTKQCWVAEAYEPFFIRCTPAEMDYDVFQADSILMNDIEVNKMRKTIVGTISVRSHNALKNANWIYRLAIRPTYPVDKIGEPLVNVLLRHSYQNNVTTVEISTTEFQYEVREMLLKIGFSMKQVYHKQILGKSIQIMKSQLGIDIYEWLASKNK